MDKAVTLILQCEGKLFMLLFDLCRYTHTVNKVWGFNGVEIKSILVLTLQNNVQ